MVLFSLNAGLVCVLRLPLGREDLFCSALCSVALPPGRWGEVLEEKLLAVLLSSWPQEKPQAEVVEAIARRITAAVS